ncbi:MAG: hypothetical protein JWO09_1672 [Bacteroidetes bacterium]|nr:hypothetical protein [Bacteroidota bacterium]
MDFVYKKSREGFKPIEERLHLTEPLKIRKMKKMMLVLLVSFATMAQAQLLSFKASTGDVEMDGILTDVDARARLDINVFKNDVALQFNIAKSQIEQAIRILSPGDLFMAAQLSISIGRPFETVVETYKTNKAKGWGAIAKEMGIKPGSAEFHAMKKSMKSKGSKGGSSGKGNSKGSGSSNGSGNKKAGKGKGNK